MLDRKSFSISPVSFVLVLDICGHLLFYDGNTFFTIEERILEVG
jgi:hypothetical protein